MGGKEEQREKCLDLSSYFPRRYSVSLVLSVFLDFSKPTKERLLSRSRRAYGKSCHQTPSFAPTFVTFLLSFTFLAFFIFRSNLPLFLSPLFPSCPASSFLSHLIYTYSFALSLPAANESISAFSMQKICQKLDKMSKKIRLKIRFNISSWCISWNSEVYPSKTEKFHWDFIRTPINVSLK